MNLKLADYKTFFIVLLLGLCATLFVEQLTRRYLHQNEAVKFEHLARQNFIAIEQALDDSFLVLNILDSFFQASVTVDKGEFKRFTSALLQKHPEIHSLAWVPVTYFEQTVAHKAPNIRGIVSDFRSQAIGGVSDIYAVDASAGQQQVGTGKVGKHAAWLKRLQQIYVQNAVRASQSISVVADSNNSGIFFVFQPCFRRPAVGHSAQEPSAKVYAYSVMVLNISDLYHYRAMTAALYNEGIDIALKYNQTNAWLLAAKAKNDREDYYLESSLNVGGQQWLLSATAPYDFFWKLSDSTMNSLLLLGVFSSLILALYIHTMKYKYQCIHQKAEQQTRQLSVSRACYQAVLDTAVDAIISINEAGIISHFNRGAENLFGYSSEEVLGHNVSMLMTGKHALNHNRYIAEYLHTGIKKVIGHSREVFGLHKDGRLIPVHLAISDTGLAGDMRFTAIIRDLSEFKAAEKKIRQHRFRLKHIVQEHTAALKKENHHLKRLSETDPLTRIANRRAYTVRLFNEVRAAKRSAQPLALVMIDIDFFKNYNDHYGHDAGDLTLQHVAEAITATLPRTTDLVARYGGEEFVVLMPATNSLGAYLVAEHIRVNVQALAIAHHYSEVDKVVTVSIGVSALQGDDLNELDLFSQADSALYAAKEKGRNQCVDYKKAQKNWAFKCVS